MKTILYIALFLIMAVQTSAQNTQKKALTSQPDSISGLSVYNLPSQWVNQDGQTIELKELRNKILVMVMIYTSCKSACPRLIADMRHIEQRLPAAAKDKVLFVFVSIDPLVDTPEHLNAFAKENQMDGEQWMFLQSTEDDTREFAAVLAVNYKRISPMDFSHSNIISVFNTSGELIYQQEGFEDNYDKTVNQIIKQAEKLK